MVQPVKYTTGIRKQGKSFDGILLVDKNEGETSSDVVRKIKKTLNVKRVGHAGTLDPFATGLLIVLLDQGTKLSPYLMPGRKRYRATMRLGVETDTLDLTGQILRSRPVPDLDPREIKERTLEFIGEIEQIPPIYSAVNLNGKRAYELARKGIKVELKKRRVRIYSIKIISIELPDITMEIECSGGTYIRSLAADIGEKLNTCAHLRALRRLTSGSFNVNDAIDLKMSGDAELKRVIENKIITLRYALPDIEAASIDSSIAKKIKNGYRPGRKEVSVGTSSLEKNDYIKLLNGESLVAVIEMNHSNDDESGWMKKIRVFN
jgi:tRNA pseudouridine55 synthase